jgi:hypothetical protein
MVATSNSNRTPRSRSLLAMAAAAIASMSALCEAVPMQMSVQPRASECLYEHAEAG